MNNLDTIKKLVEVKSKNVITDEKAAYLLDVIKRKYPSKKIEDTIANLETYSELPSWLNNDLTINETFFFRHAEHFKILEQQLKVMAQEKKSLNILCCGVSSGEEAYSIGMIAKKYFPTSFSILGVDLSQNAVEIAQSGKYPAHSKARISTEYKDLWQENIIKKKFVSKEEYFIKEELKRNVKFKVGNVFNFPLKDYDIIFIRNILIYFKDEDKNQLLIKVINKINHNGLLFIGAGEILPKQFLEKNQLISTSIMKKVA